MEQQLEKLKLKKLNLHADRIFGFKDFEEFNGKYFSKGLLAMDDLNRAKALKNARKKYTKYGQLQ